ncbi:MAG: protein kinase [Phycisphaerae bacterium]|nr:protein kinase [Phycisphaerae bacterium]
MTDPTHQRIREVFIEVCDLHGDDRDSRLDGLCGDDRELRMAVLNLLDRDTTEADLLDEKSVATGAIFGAAVGHDALPDRGFPDEIGGYRILRVIGDGGMGTVYEAEQRDPQRIIALKVLHRWSTSTSLVRRFRRETQVLGRLQHPGIAQIFEAGVHDPGDGSRPVPFFVMELVRGQQLTAYMRSHDCALRRRLEIFLQICAAVAYAHQRGVIHRDLKPDNILIGDDGNAKVIDFGIATSTAGDSPATTDHTMPGQVIGTLPYMSPEQVGGDPSRVDARTDVYALGVLLYEVLADRLPYDVRDRSLPEAARVIREETHTRLSSVNRSYRGDIETIVTKALEKDPDRRYQAVADLADDIRRHLHHEPIAARPPSTFYQLSKFASRNRAMVAGVVGVMLALGLGAVAATTFAIDANARAKAERWSSYRARIEAATAAIDRDDVVAARRNLDLAPPELRGWEWQHLDRNTDPWMTRIATPSPIVGEIAFLPDGERIAAVTRDNRLRVWDVATGRVRSELALDAEVIGVDAASTAPLLSVVTGSPEGSGDGACDVRLIDIETLTEVHRWVDAPSGIIDTDVANDGGLVVAMGRDSLTAWDARRREVLWSERLSMQDESMLGHLSISLRSDGSTIVMTVGYPQNSYLVSTFDATTGSKLGDYRSTENGRVVAFRPHHQEFASGSIVRETQVIDSASMALVGRWPGHTRSIRGISYSSNGNRVATSSLDGSVRVRDASDGTMLRIYTPGEDMAKALSMALNGDGSRLALASGSMITIGEVKAEQSTVLRTTDRYVYCVAFSPDGSLLASSSYFPSVARLWDGVTGEAVAVLGDAHSPHALRFSHDGARLLALSSLGNRSWQIGTGEVIDPLSVDDDVRAQDRIVDTERIVRDPTGTYDARHRRSEVRFGLAGKELPPEFSTVLITRVDDAEPKRTIVLDTIVSCVAFLADQRTLLVGLVDGDIAVMDIADGHEVARLRGHQDFIYSIAVSPDGRRVASGANDNSLRLWDTITWEQVFERHHHTSYIYTVTFSPDGTRIATASGDGTVRLWDSVSRVDRAAAMSRDPAR